MKKYYKCVEGCKSCSDKGVFTLEDEDADDWKCPFGSMDCNSQLKSVPWVFYHRKMIMMIGLLVAILSILLYWLGGGDGSGKVERDIAALQVKVKEWKKNVSKVPKNSGLGDPHQRLWKDRYDSKIKRLSLTPDTDIKRELEKLKEEKGRLAEELKSAKATKAPKAQGSTTLAKYGKLRAEGGKLTTLLNRTRSEAKLVDDKKFSKPISLLEKQIKDGMTLLRVKSKPPATKKNPFDPGKTKQQYVESVIEAQARVAKAITDEQIRREEEKRIAEQDRLRRLDEQARKSREQKIREWDDAIPDIRIACSSALERSLVSALVVDYLKSKRGGEARVLQHPDRISHRRYSGSKGASIEVGGSINGEASASDALSINMNKAASRNANTHVIALDAMVAMVSPSQSVKRITTSNLEKVISGRINNWSALGGQNMPIKLVVPDAESGDYAVIDAETRALINRNTAKAASKSVAGDVTRDRAMFGIGAFHSSQHVRRLTVASTPSSSGFAPTPKTITAENYRYSRRIFAHLSSNPSREVIDFLRFVESSEGQKTVARAGFIDLRIMLDSSPIPIEGIPWIPKDFGDIVSAYRLNTNFRFAVDSSNLDIKARADVSRVQESLRIHLSKNRKCLVVGFTDSQGSADHNMKLSRSRSQIVGNEFRSDNRIQGEIRTIGVGESLPIADNNTDRGMAQNRRVEVWIVEIK